MKNISSHRIDYTPVPYVNNNKTLCPQICEDYQLFKTTSTILELQILLLCVQLTCPSSQKAYVKFHLRNNYDHSFHKHTSLGSPKGTLCLNLMRYHSASIENIYCCRLPLTMTQFIGNI